MSDSTKAVFLSYASQDAAAAKRIADALRAAGVEVWFDAEGGLEHGDEWDAKIRRQIKECVLFIPVISANTEAREEGYFRIEWDLAAERARGIASGVAFILPVVVDGTKDAGALVPDRFRTVQWTKLPGGNVPAEVLQRFLKLWSHRTGLLKHEENAGRAEGRIENHESETANRAKPRWLAPVIAGGVIALLALIFSRPWEKTPPASGPSSLVSTAPAARPSEARELVAKAWVQLNKTELGRSELEAAEELCKQALARDPNEADAWAASSQVDACFVYFGLQDTPERREGARVKATRAMQIDPTGYEPRLALAGYHTRAWGNLGVSDGAPEAERLLRGLLRERPAEPRALLTLALLQRNTGRLPESYATFRQVTDNPDFAARAWNELGWAQYVAKEFADAEASADRSIALHPYWGNLSLKLYCGLIVRGDIDQAKRILEQMPPAMMQEDSGAALAVYVYYVRREPAAALRVLNNVPRDWLSAGGRSGPRAGFAGIMHEMAGHAAAARTEFLAALKVVDQRLAEKPSSPELLRWKASLLVHLERRPEAEALFRSVWEMEGGANPALEANDLTLLERPDEAVATLERAGLVRSNATAPALLRLDPTLDPLRKNPRFVALLAKLEAAERSGSVPAELKTGNREPGTASVPADAKSVAVLAFANLSDDKANEYFSDGISEELLNVLAKVPKLKVAARTSSFYFKGRNVPIPEIAQKLGVAYVVEGSVRKAGNKVRVTAQLIKAADGFHVWSETYDRDLTDIFAVQDEIAKNILGVVKGSLMGEAELPHATTTNIEAYTLYLQAQGAFARRGDAGLREAIRLYEAALAVDASYVPALVGLAQARVVLPNYAYLSGAKARETVDGAIKAARRALELDAQNATAFSVIGWAKFQFDWQWAESEVALRRARDLAPNDAWTWNCLGDYYRFVGDLPQARMAKQREWDLDPLSPNSHWDQSYLHLVAGHHDQAIHWAEICMGLAPHNVDSYMPAILAAARSDQFDLAHRTIGAARQNVSEGEGMLLLLEAYSAILEKKPDEARRLLAKVSPLAENENAPPSFLGYCHLLLGEVEPATRWLRVGYDRHDPSMVWNEIIDFDVIAANPQTRPILDRPGLKELYELRQRNARAGLNKL